MKKLLWFLFPIASWIAAGFAIQKAELNINGIWGIWWVLTSIVLVLGTIALITSVIVNQDF